MHVPQAQQARDGVRRNLDQTVGIGLQARSVEQLDRIFPRRRRPKAYARSCAAGSGPHQVPVEVEQPGRRSAADQVIERLLR